MSDGFHLDNWRGYQHLFSPPTARRSIAGISGGATSGMMAALLSAATLMSFQNTGKEHPKTYVRIVRVAAPGAPVDVLFTSRNPVTGEDLLTFGQCLDVLATYRERAE